MATVGVLSQTYLSFLTSGTSYLTIQPNVDDTATFLGMSSATVQLKNVTDPSLPSDVATKNYVDSLETNSDWKESAITSSSIQVSTSSAPASIGTFGLSVPGSRVLLYGQTSPIQNGIYIWTSIGVPLTRSLDMANGSDASANVVFVQAGTDAEKAYVCSDNSGSAIVGTDPLTFILFNSGSSASAAGNDTEIQYNNSSAFGAVPSFTFNKSSTIPVLGIGSDATSTTSTANIGTGASITTSAVNMKTLSIVSTSSTNIITSYGSSIFAMINTVDQDVSLFNTTTTGNIILGSGLTTGDIDIGSATSTININSTINASSPTVAGLVVDGGIGILKNIWTADNGSLILGTGGDLTLGHNGTNSTITNITGSLTISSTTSLILSSTNSNLKTIISSQTNLSTNIVGVLSEIQGLNFTDTNISPVTNVVFSSFATPTLSAIVPTTTTNASTVLIQGAPISGSNQTITNAWALNVNSGNTYLGGDLVVNGMIIATSSTASAAGLNTQVQFNNNGLFGASANLTWITSTNTFTIGATTGILNVGLGGQGIINIGQTILSDTSVGFVLSNSAEGGSITIESGQGTTTGDAGSINLFAGDAVDGDGGDVVIQGGLSDSGTKGSIILKTTSDDNGTKISFQNVSSVEIGRIDGTGVMYMTEYNAISDIMYKTNIKLLENPLEILNSIESYSYNWKKEFNIGSDKKQIGIIAQQLEEVGLDHLVSTSIINGRESKSVNYLGLIPILISSINQLSKQFKVINKDTFF